MNTRLIAYWLCTGIVAAAFLAGGAAHLLHVPWIVDGILELGYPPHFILLLGVWKILGAVAILAPRTPLVKEWAYAGIFFELTGAAVAEAVAGPGARHVATPLALCAVAVASWALRPERRRLPRPSPQVRK